MCHAWKPLIDGMWQAIWYGREVIHRSGRALCYMLQAAEEGDGNAPSSSGAAETDSAEGFGAQMRAAAQARRQELGVVPKQARPVTQALPNCFVSLWPQQAYRPQTECVPTSSRPHNWGCQTHSVCSL